MPLSLNFGSVQTNKDKCKVIKLQLATEIKLRKVEELEIKKPQTSTGEMFLL